MPDPPLHGCRILVVEDEYLLADELQWELGQAGAVILGPASSVVDAMALIRSEPRIDGGILDVNLGGEFAFAVADDLAGRGVPFLFTTGYDRSVIPGRFANIPCCQKPIDSRRIARAIGRVIHA